MRSPFRLAAVLTAGLLLTACGGGDDLSPAAAATLGRDVDAITAAARADDEGRVQALLLQLRENVEQLQSDGEIDQARASRVLAAAARVATDVGAPEPEVVVSVAPPRPPPPQPAPPKDDDKGDEDKDEGKRDEGRDKDDD